MVTFKEEILKQYGSVYAFAKAHAFSGQKAHYLANRLIDNMTETTVVYMCGLLDLDVKLLYNDRR